MIFNVMTILRTVVLFGIFNSCLLQQAPHQLCRDNEVNLSEVSIGSRVQVSSENYPSMIPDLYTTPNACHMTITVCEHCRMQLTVEEVMLPNNCGMSSLPLSCYPNSCDYLTLYDPDYLERTLSTISQNTSFSMTTETRRLTITFCRHTLYDAGILFSLYVDILDNTVHVEGTTGDIGFLTSPFFPQKYNTSVGVNTYSYVLEHQRSAGKIKVHFTDWNLMPESFFVIAFHEDRSQTIRAQGTDGRFFAVSTGNMLYIDFHTGREDPTYIYGQPFPGFRLQYEFMNDETVNLPIACGEYITDVWGGHFSSPDTCETGRDYDCIWVFSKQKNQDRFEEVQLYFRSFTYGTLEVRKGVVSTGDIVASTERFDLHTDRFYSDPVGLYVHFTFMCQESPPVLEATFATVENLQLEFDCDAIQSGFWCANLGHCIHDSLVCDGHQHCQFSYGKDELGCPVNHGCGYMCDNGVREYCYTQRCDGVRDCNDGADENSCEADSGEESDGSDSSNTGGLIAGILIPLLLCLAFAVVACVVYRRHKQRKAERSQVLAAAHVPGSLSALPASSFASLAGPGSPPHSPPYAMGGFLAFPEHPPSYEASQSHINASYTRSMSTDLNPRPPPYAAVHTAPANKTRFHTSTVSLPAIAHASGVAGASSSAQTQNLSNPVLNSDSRLSLTGAGALYYSPSPSGSELKTEPANQNQSYIDASHDNEVNLNLEEINDHERAADTNVKSSKAPRAKRKRRSRARSSAAAAAETTATEVTGGGVENEAYSPSKDADNGRESCV